MIVKRYLVKNMNEAMTRIRYELGKDAIIISQRKVRESGIKGFFSPKLIEVTAALENSKSNISKKQEEKDTDFSKSIDDIKRLISSEKNNIKAKTIEEDKPKAKEKELEAEVKEMKELLSKILKNTNPEEKEDKILDLITSLDIDFKYIKEIREVCKDEEEFKDKLYDYIFKEVSIYNEDINGRVVFVGPTGVGKTTTIAKLAGRLALIEKKKVGLITIDTYRIGAVEQLKTYAEIMNIPFKVVITTKEMQEAIKEMEDLDVILIDTTGRSSKNEMQLSELRAFVQKAEPNHNFLVISSVTKNNDLYNIIENYGKLDFDKVIITKLDETLTYGALYTIIKEAKKPIGYITTGQNVPDDIRVPKKEEITRFILGEDSIC